MNDTRVDQQLTERDLLIRLSTKMEWFEQTLRDFGTKITLRDTEVDELKERLTCVEADSKENSKLRNWVYASMIGVIISLLTVVGILLSILGVRL